MTKSTRINCLKCQHFYVTWDPKFPKGCKAYDFKSRNMPSQAVLNSSGQPCLSYEPKSHRSNWLITHIHHYWSPATNKTALFP